jgi:hypothetical protein
MTKEEQIEKTLELYRDELEIDHDEYHSRGCDCEELEANFRKSLESIAKAARQSLLKELEEKVERLMLYQPHIQNGFYKASEVLALLKSFKDNPIN